MLLKNFFLICYKDEDQKYILLMQQQYQKTNNLGNYCTHNFDVKGNSTIQRVIESSQHKCKQNGETQF